MVPKYMPVRDSILNNLDESKLTKKNIVVKVRAFPGSNIGDVYSYIVPLLHKQPIIIIIIRLTCQFHSKWVAQLLCLF